MTFQSIYLDNNTLAKPSEKCISSMLPFLSDLWGSPTSPHYKGQELYPALGESYRALYNLLGAHEEDQILFTSSGAEAVNHVFLSVYQDVAIPTGKNQFITSHLDEAPAILSMGRLDQLGCLGKMISPSSHGFVTAEDLADILSPRTALVSLSCANGLTGVIQPINDIAALCKQRGILLHLDVTHLLGKLFFEVDEVGADFISFNGDQLHAPKGSGALYIKRGVKCSPFIVGGSDQAGQRAGSLNMPNLVALATAAREAIDSRDFLCTEIARLRDLLEEGILTQCPEAQVLFRNQERLPHCTAIAFPGLSNEALLFYLNRKNVYASIGGGFFQQISLLLKACHLPEEIAHSTLSFALSRYTTEEEVERAIVIISESVNKLLKMSSTLTTVKPGTLSP